MIVRDLVWFVVAKNGHKMSVSLAHKVQIFGVEKKMIK